MLRAHEQLDRVQWSYQIYSCRFTIDDTGWVIVFFDVALSRINAYNCSSINLLSRQNYTALKIQILRAFVYDIVINYLCLIPCMHPFILQYSY